MTNRAPRSEAPVPSTELEVLPHHGIVLDLDGPSLQTGRDAEGNPLDIVAELHLPKFLYGPGCTMDTVSVVRVATPGKSKRRPGTPEVHFYRPGQDGQLERFEPYTLALGLGGGRDKPGYTFSAAVTQPVTRKRAQSPAQLCLTLKSQREKDPTLPLEAIFQPPDTSITNLPIVTTAAGTKIEDQPNRIVEEMQHQAHDQGERRKRRQTLHKVGQAAVNTTVSVGIVAGATVGTLQTGGIIDTIKDRQSDAGDQVKEWLHTPGEDAETSAAIDRVANIMHALDTHDTATINAAAAEFKNHYPGEFMADAEVQKFCTQVEQATTYDDAMAVMDEFLGFYDKEAGFSPSNTDSSKARPFSQSETSLDLLKQYMLGVIDAYSYLPSSYIRSANFDNMEFGTAPTDFDTKADEAGGDYIRRFNGYNSIAIAVAKVANNPRGLAAVIALHEMAHSKDELDDHDSSGAAPTDEEMSDFSWKEFWDNPDYASLYAAANSNSEGAPLSDEEYAEIVALMLAPIGPDQSRLFHPDNARYFESPANRKSLAVLVELEKQYPGITSLIVHRVGLTDYDRYNRWYTFKLNADGTTTVAESTAVRSPYAGTIDLPLPGNSGRR